MTEKRYSRMTNHYGTSRTYCTGVYDNQNNRELKNVSQVITELNSLHEENEQLKNEIEKIAYANENLLKEKREWEKLSDEYAKLYEENEQLKKDCTALVYHNHEYRKENKQLKEFIDELYKKYEDAHGMNIENTDWF